MTIIQDVKPIPRSISTDKFKLEQPMMNIDNHKPSVADRLSSLGEFYQYQGFNVVPSQYYSRWSGQDTKIVNETIDRLAEQGRLEIKYDFFRLTEQEAFYFFNITNCDLTEIELRQGLVLITLRAVNMLTHCFDDPNSIIKRKLIMSGITSIEAIFNSGLSSKDNMILMHEWGLMWLDADKERSLRGGCR